MIDFPRYLAAKVSVDDRALNRQVWEQLVASVAALDRSQPLRILELGCGIGTMVERLLEWGFAERVDYLGIDVQDENIHHAITRLGEWASAHGFKLAKTIARIRYSKRKYAIGTFNLRPPIRRPIKPPKTATTF